MRRFTCFAIGLSLCLSLVFNAVSASATLITFFGYFQATDFNPAAGIPASISGSWESTVFDTSSAPVMGYVDLGVASVSVNPSPWGNAFDASNTGIVLFFRNGLLDELWVGGLLGGVNVLPQRSTDDFEISYFPTGPLRNFWTVAGNPGLNGNGVVSGAFQFVPVPEASADLFVLTGLLGLAARRKRRAQSCSAPRRGQIAGVGRAS